MPEGIIIPNPLGSCGVYCEKKNNMVHTYWFCYSYGDIIKIGSLGKRCIWITYLAQQWHRKNFLWSPVNRSVLKTLVHTDGQWPHQTSKETENESIHSFHLRTPKRLTIASRQDRSRFYVILSSEW